MREASKSNRSGQLLFVLILVAALATQPSGSFAQDGGEQVIADGSYFGVMAAEGIFFFDYSIPAFPDQIEMSWDGKLEGDFTLDVVLGELDGTWQMAGDTIIEGEFGADTGALMMSGPQHSEASGEITGTATRSATRYLLDNFQFEGQSTTSTQLSVAGDLADLLNLSSLPPRTDTAALSIVVTDLVSIKCHSFVGDWTQDIKEGAEAAQLTAVLDGTFSAVRRHDANPEDIEDQIRDLVTRGLSLINNIRSGTGSIAALTTWANDANQVMFSIERDLECGQIEDDTKYLTPITNIVYQMVKLLNNAPAFHENTTLNTVFGVAVGQAMLGPGWPGRGDISKLSEQIDSNLQISIENDIIDGVMDSDEAKIYLDSAQATGSEGAEEAVVNWQNNQGGG